MHFIFSIRIWFSFRTFFRIFIFYYFNLITIRISRYLIEISFMKLLFIPIFMRKSLNLKIFIGQMIRNRKSWSHLLLQSIKVSKRSRFCFLFFLLFSLISQKFQLNSITAFITHIIKHSQVFNNKSYFSANSVFSFSINILKFKNMSQQQFQLFDLNPFWWIILLCKCFDLKSLLLISHFRRILPQTLKLIIFFFSLI